MGLLEQQNDSLLPVTANPKMLAQALKARQQPRTQLTGQGLLDTAAIGLSPVPVIGDALGLAADASRFYNEPESRTPLNFGLAALGMLPFIPSGVGAVKKMTQYEKAHEVAQRNAALPVSQGGLGLPPNNTAMDRAKAMGFDTSAYHGTNAEINAFDPMMADTRRKTGTPNGAVVVSSNPNTANTYAGQSTDNWGNISGYSEGGNVIPLMINKGKNLSINAKGSNWGDIYSPRYPDAETTNEIADIAKAKGKDSATVKNVRDNATWSKNEDGIDRRIGDTTFLFNPALLRSRFAAFDPMRRNSSDLLANVAPFGLAGLLGLGLYDAKQGD